MNRIDIYPASREDWLKLRTEDITSTEIAALFSLSPYKTALEVYAEKSGKLSDSFKESERTKWGNLLQDAIASGVAEDKGLTIQKRTCYTRITERRIGASFDFEIIGDPRGPGILEIKNVDSLVFRNSWSEFDGVVEAPSHIELQLQHQLLVSGFKWGIIAALVGGNTLKLIEREANPALQNTILDTVARFWVAVDEGKAPAPIYPRDAAVITRMHQQAAAGTEAVIEDGSPVNAFVADYFQASAEAKAAEERKETAKAQILEAIGETEKIYGHGWTISAAEIAAKEIPATMRKAYRSFRITQKKAIK
jgi:putative phage-type endonuclease